MTTRTAMMPRTAHMAIAANSGSPPIHSLHRRHAALHFCDSFFPHCGFSRDGCVMPSDGSPGSSAMLPPLEPSLRMIPWYPAIGPESENAVDASRGNRCGTWRSIPRSPRSRPEPFGPRIPPYAAMRPSRVPAGVAHGSGMTLPDVYLEVQHPCRSCNSSSSPANAPAGVWIGNGVLDGFLGDESLFGEFVGAPVCEGGVESLVVGPPHIVVGVGA